jgi:hypothetical protein
MEEVAVYMAYVLHRNKGRVERLTNETSVTQETINRNKMSAVYLPSMFPYQLGDNVRAN